MTSHSRIVLAILIAASVVLLAAFSSVYAQKQTPTQPKPTPDLTKLREMIEQSRKQQGNTASGGTAGAASGPASKLTKY